MASGPITSWQIDGETKETVTTLFSWAPKSLQMGTAAIKLKDICSLEENSLQCSCLENPRNKGAWWAAVYGITQSDNTEVT